MANAAEPRTSEVWEAALAKLSYERRKRIMERQQVDRQPFFNPWIGQEYRETLRSLISGDIRNGILDRVHLMGESHYSDEKLSPDWTTELIRRHGAREGPGIPFLTKVLQVMSQNEDCPSSEHLAQSGARISGG